MVNLRKTVKVWMTIERDLREELASLSKEMGFRSETDCLRETIRLGAENLRAQRSLSAGLTKKRDSILAVAGLLAEEYERMKPRELELKTRARWK